MKCPGQDSRYWKPDAVFEVACPQCQKKVEFFKDDTSRKCGHCGHRFANPRMDFGCAAYCQFAEQCIGTLPPEVVARQQDLLKDRVALEMKRYLKTDFKRIGHAAKVARYAERIGMMEGGNLAVILAAAYLHDIGIREAERKHGSAAPRYREMEGPPVAKAILEKLGAKAELIQEVCEIIARHHHPREEESVNFKVLHDAGRIADLEEKQAKEGMAPDQLRQTLENTFLTPSGRIEAGKVFDGK